MLLRIPGVLAHAQVTAIRARIDAARWIDGNVTSGHQSAQAKRNEQLPEASAESRETGETIVMQAGRTPTVLARNDVGERAIASPAISNGQIFIRTDDHVFAIGTPARRSEP